ncbi:MAG: hypothetical protein PHQ70_07950 [Arcobacter sp.]|uniref:c-type cytochrome n=1 Tax=Arcobacter sp. TaxID=1872629 RepID=UPI00259006D1|nr:c-type cytochrome [Arcobacter sp.]MDD3008782.1 hypothetical protein [Arcobacter sp.]
MNKILLSSAAIAVLLLSGCGDDKKTQQATAEVTIKQETTKEVVSEAAKEVSNTVTTAATEVSKTVVDTTTKVTENAVKDVKETVAPVAQEVKETITTQVSNVAEKVNETQNDVKEAISTATNEVQEVVKVEEGPNGELLFKACASCHGQKGEKEALGKSQIIAGWDKEKTINALNGYKAGTYGGVMKNIMKTQIDSKTDAEIDALATFISNL